jgi:hypothetical protein
MKNIYVQIPAYRDSELAPTLINIFAKAAYPQNLRVAVCWQHAPTEVLPPQILLHPQIEIIDVNHQDSGGCNWARRQLQKRWKGEPYTLFLDSHHRFIEGWDQHLIDMYEKLLSDGNKKPLITAYLPPYVPETDPVGRAEDPLQIFRHSREKGMLIYLIAYKIPLWRWLDKPIEAKFTSLHFIFAAGSFNQEMIFDDNIYFFGDEVVLALRAYTYGYQLFHPHYVIGWHLYYRDQTRITHWEDHSDYMARHEQSYQRIRNIFLGVDDKELGTARSIQDYEYFIQDKLITY